MKIKVKTALVSVSDKQGLERISEYFIKNDILVFSSGGTYNHLKKINPRLKLIEVSSYTKFNEILDGRVKTLHPLIHAGILADKYNSKHISQLNLLKIKTIDLVIVNLYPFEKTLNKSNSTESDCIENIDIGGPSLIRGAAKNYKSVVVLSSPSQYDKFVSEMKKNNNNLNLEFRKELAMEAFQNTSYYDSIISKWLTKGDYILVNENSALPLKKLRQLRYGENPHQTAALFSLGKNKLEQISGKDLSYNNINDLEIAMELADQFQKKSCVILKHGNPCGVSLDNDQHKAYKKALQCDPTSAFGGIVAFNKPVTSKTAEEILKLFTEMVVAPSFSLDAKKILTSKKSLILVEYKSKKSQYKSLSIKSSRNFLLIQDKDTKKTNANNFKFKTSKPSQSIIDDMAFAFTVSKFVNSNAIVIVKNLSTIGIGIGQTNRIDSAKQAIKKANKNFPESDGVLASDGFFPFPDIVKICSKNNIKGIIQPGGSINDDKVIDEARKNKIPLVFSGIRHFKH
tara:strand:+ start:1127 stop:2665 length:1539 start_codon:yes stop_codon:yes gene_type:complete